MQLKTDKPIYKCVSDSQIRKFSELLKTFKTEDAMNKAGIKRTSGYGILRHYNLRDDFDAERVIQERLTICGEYFKEEDLDIASAPQTEYSDLVSRIEALEENLKTLSEILTNVSVF